MVLPFLADSVAIPHRIGHADDVVLGVRDEADLARVARPVALDKASSRTKGWVLCSGQTGLRCRHKVSHVTRAFGDVGVKAAGARAAVGDDDLKPQIGNAIEWQYANQHQMSMGASSAGRGVRGDICTGQLAGKTKTGPTRCRVGRGVTVGLWWGLFAVGFEVGFTVELAVGLGAGLAVGLAVGVAVGGGGCRCPQWRAFGCTVGRQRAG